VAILDRIEAWLGAAGYTTGLDEIAALRRRSM
jgi:hypothetical protein